MEQPITNIKVKLLGEDGNAFNIISKVSKDMLRAGYSKDFVDEYKNQAMSGDYDTVLQTTMTYVKVV